MSRVAEFGRLDADTRSEARRFGQSVIEALACGTPVVASRRSSMAEVIDDGVTGFAVTSQYAAVAAVGIAAWLDRDLVRETARRGSSVMRGPCAKRAWSGCVGWS